MNYDYNKPISLTRQRRAEGMTPAPVHQLPRRHEFLPFELCLASQAQLQIAKGKASSVPLDGM